VITSIRVAAIPSGGGKCSRRPCVSLANVAAMPLWAGESVNFVTHRQPAGDIVRELIEEAEQHLVAHGIPRADTKPDSRVGASESHLSQPH